MNRVTFYDHYADKFALLECVVGSRFQELLTERGVKFDGTCSSALKAIVRGVCDYLSGTFGNDADRQRQMGPHLESAVIAVIRRMILEGLQRHPGQTPITPQILATTLSWAIYGGAQEWARTSNRSSPEEGAATIMMLVAPILDLTRH